MYCGNCGNKLNEGDLFCDHCGNAVGSNSGSSVSVNGQVVNQPKKKKNIGLIVAIASPLIFFALVLGVFIFIFIMLFSSLNGVDSEEFVQLSGDEIPTIYQVIGYKSICDYDSSNVGDELKMMYVYCNGELTNYDYEKYINYLIIEEDFVDTTTFAGTELTKESNDDNMYLTIDIDKQTGTIVYTKKKLTGGNI